MSDDPERNGISRLDEMMSGVVRSILDRVACFLYCIRITFTLLQICRCDSAESPLDTDRLDCVVPCFIVSWRPG